MMNNGSYVKKIGILGGTFNPIHIGHLMLAENALEYCGLDKVLIMPSACSYFKDQSNIASPGHRLDMAKLAIKGNDRFELSTIEVDRGGYTYTYETLEKLCCDDPRAEYYYIVGADTLLQMEKWKKPDVIFSKCTIVCVGRDKITAVTLKEKAAFLSREYGAEIIIMDIPEVPISSTMIRAMLVKNMTCKYYLDDGVIKYIKDNGLYSSTTHQVLHGNNTD